MVVPSNSRRLARAKVGFASTPGGWGGGRGRDYTGRYRTICKLKLAASVHIVHIFFHLHGEREVFFFSQRLKALTVTRVRVLCGWLRSNSYTASISG